MKILMVLDNLESLISMFLILEVKEKGTKNHRGLLLDQTDLNYLFQKPLWSLSISPIYLISSNLLLVIIET